MIKQLQFGLFYMEDNINLTCMATEYLESGQLTISISVLEANISVIRISVYLLIDAKTLV